MKHDCPDCSPDPVVLKGWMSPELVAAFRYHEAGGCPVHAADKIAAFLALTLGQLGCCEKCALELAQEAVQSSGLGCSCAEYHELCVYCGTPVDKLASLGCLGRPLCPECHAVEKQVGAEDLRKFALAVRKETVDDMATALAGLDLLLTDDDALLFVDNIRALVGEMIVGKGELFESFFTPRF